MCEQLTDIAGGVCDHLERISVHHGHLVQELQKTNDLLRNIVQSLESLESTVSCLEKEANPYGDEDPF